MAGNSSDHWKIMEIRLEMTGNGWNCLIWMEMAKKNWKLPEMTLMARYGQK